MTAEPYYRDELVELWHGDCRKLDAWLAADVLVTDPPYGMAYVSGWAEHGAIAGDSDTRVRDDALALWGDRPALVFGRWDAPRPSATRARLVWDKGESPGMGDLRMPWGRSDEEVYVLGSGFAGRRSGTILRSRVQSAGDRERPEHPTPKPVSLMELLIEKCPTGVIADPFAGSGSTLLAARYRGRRAIGVEVHEPYCELVARRLATRGATLFALPGESS